MRITPLDIIQKQFVSNKKGFDPDEVSNFLEEIRETLEELLRENHDQRVAMSVQDKEIERLRAAESELKETLMAARKFADEMRGSARRESDLVLGEARLEAQRVLSAAHDEHRDLLQEVMHLKGVRLQLVAQIRAIVEAHARLIDDLDAQTSVAGGLET